MKVALTSFHGYFIDKSSLKNYSKFCIIRRHFNLKPKMSYLELTFFKLTYTVILLEKDAF